MGNVVALRPEQPDDSAAVASAKRAHPSGQRQPKPATPAEALVFILDEASALLAAAQELATTLDPVDERFHAWAALKDLAQEASEVAREAEVHLHTAVAEHNRTEGDLVMEVDGQPHTVVAEWTTPGQSWTEGLELYKAVTHALTLKAGQEIAEGRDADLDANEQMLLTFFAHIVFDAFGEVANMTGKSASWRAGRVVKGEPQGGLRALGINPDLFRSTTGTAKQKIKIEAVEPKTNEDGSPAVNFAMDLRDLRGVK